MKNNKGAVLSWVAVVFLVVTALIAAITSIALSYNKKAVELFSEKQAYLTNKSLLNAISDEITSGTEVGQIIVSSILSSPDDTCVLDNFASDFNGLNGDSVIVATKIDINTITLKATTVVGSKTSSLSISLVSSEEIPGFKKTIFPTLLRPDDYEYIEWPEPIEKTHYVYKSDMNPHEIITLGNGNDADTYYFIDKDSNFKKQGKIEVSGTGNIYVFIRDNCNGKNSFCVDEVSAATVEKDGESINTPMIYFIVGENCNISINEFRTDLTQINAYIYSPYESSTVTIGKNSNNYTEFYGSIISASNIIDNVGKNLTMTYVKPFKEPYISPRTTSDDEDEMSDYSDIIWTVASIKA